jgi:hypothetical protein
MLTTTTKYLDLKEDLLRAKNRKDKEEIGWRCR